MDKGNRWFPVCPSDYIAMEYYPQDSVLLDIARERIRQADFGARFAPLPKAIKKQVKVVLDSCGSDTEMFVLLSELLHARQQHPASEALNEFVQELLR